MKIIYSIRAKWLIGNFITIFLLVVLFLYASRYIFGINYSNVFTAMTEIETCEVKNRLLMEAMNDVGVCNPERAAGVWANGLKSRSAAMQYSAMSLELKNEYAQQLDQSFPNWVTGISSPWIDSFEIIKTERPADDRYIFNLLFKTATSTGPAGDYNAELTVVLEKDIWRISNISMDKQLYVYTGFSPIAP